MADPLTYANSDEYVLVNPNDPKVGHLIYDAPMVDAETKQFIRDPETGKIKVYRMVIWGTKGLTQTQVEALITEKNASMVTKVNTLETRITNFLDADDSTLDQLSELITEIKANKANIALIVSNKATKEELQEAVNTINTNIANSYVALANNQTITGNKTFTGEVNVPTVNSVDSSTKAASTAFVQAALGALTGTSVENLVTKNAEQTITGLKTFNNDVLFGSNGLRIKRNDTDKYIIIEAGADSSTASSVTISGTTRTNSEGVISLIARDSNNNNSNVYLKPDGTFVKDGNKIITQSDLANYVALSGNQTMTGVKTFTNTIVGSITGNAATATKATQDSDGNTIKTTYAKLNSPALTGTPTAPTASTNTNNTQIATTAYVKAQGYLTSHQSLDSCVKTSGNQTIAGVKTFSSSPKAPTPATTTNDTTVATTAYVKAQGYLTSHQSLDNCVKTSGNQTVAGVKTFSSVPVCATNPTANNQLANKAYVDSKATSAKATYCTTTPSTTSTASSTKPAVVVTNYRNGNSWYRKWSDGFIEQGSTQPVEDSWINFMVSFSNTNYTLINAGFVMAGIGRQVVSKYKNGFQASSDVVTCGTYAWYACGY